MSKRILLVEDESSLHDLLKLNLEMDGHKVIGVKMEQVQLRILKISNLIWSFWI